MRAMELHSFTVVLDREPLDDEFDALYEAGLGDSSPEYGAGKCVIHVDRMAVSLETAIISVVEQVAAAGFSAIAIEDEDAVDIRGLAARLGRSYESVRLLAMGRRGPGGFPAPLPGYGRMKVYSWNEVAGWFRERMGEEHAQDEHARVMSAANHLLRARAMLPDLMSLEPLIRSTHVALEAAG